MKKTFSFLLLMLIATAGMAQNSENSISVVKDAQSIKYNPMIFGQFIEHFDNQVYGGIFDPGNPLSDEDGFRTDVIEAIKDLKTPIVRWPGGCFVSTYHWLDGVGPNRQPVYDKTWQVEDPNTFGTDEYVKWCRKVGCEPYICTNAGTGTPEEMSDWVEYCNLTVGKWARKRIENGHPEPYNVKYWSVGNENWGRHELGARTVEEWGPMVCESAKLMRSVTKDAKLFAAATSNADWSLPLLKAAGWILDYISIHGYWDPLYHVNNPAPFADCMMKTDAPEKDILRAIGILEKAGYGNGKIKIAYDEWNLRNWHHPWHGNLRLGFDHEARRKNDIASTYTMADALFSACFLNACLRHADIVDIACFSPIVNTRGGIFVHKDGIVRRTTYYTLWMYANLLESHVLPISTSAATLVKGNAKTGMIDAVLTTDEQGKRFVLAVVNKDENKEAEFGIDFAGMGKKAPKSLNAQIMTGRTADDYNDIGDEHVRPAEAKLKVKNGSVILPAHSLSFITIE